MADAALVRGMNHRPAGQIVFLVKSRLLMLRRGLRNAAAGQRRLPQRPAGSGNTVLAADQSALFTVVDPRERDLELGKIENLRVAARLLDGTVIPAGTLFSFWRQIGRPTARRGFVVGRELRQGCLIPTIGGGICQLTNALSRVATHAGATIVERHGHTARIDGVAMDETTDATVFWNYLDLAFRLDSPAQLSVTLDRERLNVSLIAMPRA